MSDLHYLYQKLLATFDFSIVGYNNIERKMEQFFFDFSEHSGALGMQNLDYISFAYAKLETILPWKLSPLNEKQFFFNSFQERSSEQYITNEYYAFKNFISYIKVNEFEKRKLSFSKELHQRILDLKTAELISELFAKPTPFRVILSDTNYIISKYNKHTDLITFEIPIKHLFSSEIQTFSQARDEIFTIFENQNNSTFKFKKDGYIYSETDENTDFKSFTEKLIDKVKLKKLINKLSIEIKELSRVVDFDLFRKMPQDDLLFLLESYSKAIISHSQLSLLFGSWVESIPSVIYVDEVTGEKRSLGSLIIGYKIENELSSDQRTVFRLISDKLSSNLASDAMSNIYPQVKFARLLIQQVSFLEKFSNEVLFVPSDSILGPIDHFNRPLDQIDIDRMESFFSSNRGNLKNIGLKGFEEFVISKFQLGSEIGKGEFVCLHNGSCKEKYKKTNQLYDNVKGENLGIEIDEDVEPYINILLFHKLLTTFDEEGNVESKTLTYENDTLDIDLKFDGPISINSLISSLSKEDDTAYNKSIKGNLGRFLVDNYEDINIASYLKLGCKEKADSDSFHKIIDFSQDLIPEYKNEKVSKLVVKQNLEFDKDTYDELCYRVVFKSI